MIPSQPSLVRANMMVRPSRAPISARNGILLSTIDEENVVLHRVDACAAVFGGGG